MVTSNLRFLPTKATFQLQERIGAGTVGVVYRATSPDIDGPVAVKLLHPAVASDPLVVERFEREVTVMERLGHPHIVRHFGGGMLDGQYFYAMQLLDHGSLKERLRESGLLHWPQAAAVGAQIASALQHAHNHGIVHRDLKPGNLFFAADGRVLLGDFGIALDTHSADVTDHGMTVGTYAYMAPEQIRGDRSISGKADLYSLGCVIYEMLTGSTPYSGANFAQIWQQHLDAQPQSIREQGIDCPGWLDSLVLKLLSKDSDDRPFNARAVQGILRQHLEEEFGAAAKDLTKDLPLDARRVDRQVKPRMWILWLVLALIAIGLIAIMTGSR